MNLELTIDKYNLEQYRKNKLSVDEQIKILSKNTSRIFPENGLRLKLEENRPLNIKLGIDPTSTSIHLGFAVVLKKMREFQDLGHNIILVIGDYTAAIGDPTGVSKTRPVLTPKQIEHNSKTYIDQACKMLNPIKKITVEYNSTWLRRLEFSDILSLMSKMTLAQIMERDDFNKRYEDHQSIGFHELMYPLVQAYDSVKLNADIELGGQDQIFNIIAGRHLQTEVKSEHIQIGMVMPLLVGLDGVRKMSKSYSNHIGITDPPDEMFSKIMSLPDTAMESYFNHFTDMEDCKSIIDSNPMEAKIKLSNKITSFFHNEEKADKAQEEWINVHSKRNMPEKVNQIVITPDGENIWMCKLIVDIGGASSNSAARRLMTEGGVSVGGVKMTDPTKHIDFSCLNGKVVQIGKKFFIRVMTQKT